MSKGYIYTKMFDKLYVHAKDLPKSSGVKVKYTCDTCGERVEVNYYNFNRSNNCQCQSCANKIIAENHKKLFSDVKLAFEAMGYVLKSSESDYKNANSKLICTCKEHGDFTTTYQVIAKGSGCMKCWLDNNSGSNSGSWKGGVTDITKYLRSQLSPWIQSQLQRVNYKCELTGKSGNLNVHHMHSFKDIFYETMDELQLDIRPSCNDYSEDELQLLVVNFLKNNELKANPIVMLESIHKQFHKFCSGTSKETTFEQLEEFKGQLRISMTPK